MAQIAEDLLLLLLDNASSQPALDRERCDRVLAGAALFDLAYACRVRPSIPGERIEGGKLVALAGTGPLDPLLARAFEILKQRPLTPPAALSRLRKDATEHVAAHLDHLGEVSRMPLSTKRFQRHFAWPITRRDRVALARSALLSALFDGRPPTPPTAGIVTLLHAVDGLGTLLSLNDRGWRWVHARATEISSGSWVSEYGSQPELPEMNLAVTASAVKAALA